MRRVLVITYYWPPSGGPGVQRWLKFCKYLPDYHVQPYVLTVDEECASYTVLDESLGKDVSSQLPVFRTKSTEILHLYKKFNKKKGIPGSGFATYQGRITLKESLFRFIRGNFFIPDARRGWNKYALREACRIIDSENITTVVTTGPPHSTHLIGEKIKKRYPKIRWVVDFRDPWTDIYYNEMLSQTFIAKKYDAYLEKRVLRKSDHVLVVGESLKRLLLKKSENLNPVKFTCISNGFDSDDFSVLPKEKGDKFKLIYLGSANKDYPLEILLISLSELTEETSRKIELELVGSFDETISNLLKKYDKAGFEITLNLYISHDKVPQKLNEADLLLLLIPKTKDNELIITGKIFEYLAMKKSILGIGPVKGDASVILRDSGAGKFFDYEDIEGVKEFLVQNFDSAFLPSYEKINQFSRSALTEKLSHLL